MAGSYEPAVFYLKNGAMIQEPTRIPADEHVTIPLRVVELEHGNIHLVMETTFGDSNTLNWIIDTGASKTVFDKNLDSFFSITNDQTEEIHSAGVAEQPMEVSTGTLKPFKAGNVTFRQTQAAIMDLSHINRFYQKTVQMKICGLIGGDFLLKYQSVIDYQKRTIRLLIRK